MEPTVLVNRDVQAYINDMERDSRLSAEVGVLLGIVRQQCEILEYISMPHEEESEDEAGSTVERVMEGLIDHGCYVNRILPGGLEIIGIYCIVNKAENQIYAREAKKAIKKIHDDRYANGSHERVRLLIDRDGAKSATLLVASRAGITDEKSAKIEYVAIPDLVPILSKYPVEMHIPLVDAQPSLRTITKHILGSETSTIEEVIGVLGSNTLVDNQTIEQEIQNGALQLQLFSQFGRSGKVDGGSVGGYLTMKGVLDCRAVGKPTDSIADAIEFLKADVLNTLRIRLQILKESQEDDRVDSGPRSRAHSYALPRRVWGKARFGIHLCEYVLDDETKEDAIHSIEEIINHALEQVEDGEQPQRFKVQPGPWDPFSTRAQNKQGSVSSLYVVSLLVGLLAILVGVVFYFSKDSH